MAIQLRPSTQAYNVHDKGTAVPAWYGDYANKNKWWYDGVPASGNTNGFYSTVTASATSVHTYLQYGQNTTGWAACRLFDQNVVVTSQTENADGSITVSGNVTVGAIATYRTDFFVAGVPVQFTVRVNGQVIHSHGGLTGDQYLELPNPQTVAFTTTVPALQESNVTTVQLDWVYPTHVYPDAHFVLGTALYNPTPPYYTPWAIMKNGQWKSLDANNGKFEIMKSGTWTDISNEVEPSGGVNEGHNQIMKSGQWKKQSKF